MPRIHKPAYHWSPASFLTFAQLLRASIKHDCVQSEKILQSAQVILITMVVFCIDLNTPEDSVKIPRYDKSAFSGLGDRADPSTWPTASGPVDIVLFEGWMLGFKAIDPEEVVKVSPHLAPINKALKSLEGEWDSFVDSWLVVKLNTPEYVFKWRLEAEQKMRKGGKPGMTDEQITDFCNRYMPAYRAYLPGLYAHGPTTMKQGKCLMIELDESRSPTAEQPGPPGALQGEPDDISTKPGLVSQNKSGAEGQQKIDIFKSPLPAVTSELFFLCILVFLI